MAIVTISRIQHRTGYYENLPQLAAAEFGWAIDQRRLFIGNGSLSEGAPAIGNTEILTEYSDVLSVAQTYSFKNQDAGYTPTTGPTANAPVLRTMQRKFDDFASVKDFGAKGDGATDDTAAINRALYQLYCVSNFEGARKALYFPAGHYVITDQILLPPYAALIGEGPYSTIIDHHGNPAVHQNIFQTADSRGQTGGALGTNGATLPSDILVENMGLLASFSGVYINSTKRITFSRVRITGKETAPSAPTTQVPGVNTSSIGVYITGSTGVPSEDINFVDCYFNKFNFAFYQDLAGEFFESLIMSSCTFQELYQGMLVAVDAGSAKNIVITSSVFDKVYSSAINLGSVANFVSSFNYYRDVANGNQGVGNPIAPVIQLTGTSLNSASMGDLFDRNTADNLVYPRFVGSPYSTFLNYGESLTLGYLTQKSGNTCSLTDNTSGGYTTCQINLLTSPHAQVSYNVKRNGNIRSGVLNLAWNGSTYSIDDDSTETANVGVVFDVNIGATYATVTYTTTSTGYDATFFYAVKKLKDVV
jgi:hypothetical protein